MIINCNGVKGHHISSYTFNWDNWSTTKINTKALHERFLDFLLENSLSHLVDKITRPISNSQWRNSYGLRVGAPAGTRVKGAPAQKVKKKRGRRISKRKNEKKRKEGRKRKNHLNIIELIDWEPRGFYLLRMTRCLVYKFNMNLEVGIWKGESYVYPVVDKEVRGQWPLNWPRLTWLFYIEAGTFTY